MSNTFFPFTVHNPWGFRNVFLERKPNGLTFYEFDVIVRSKTSVTFVVYGVRDNFYGGRGEEIKKMVANNISAKEIRPMIISQLEAKAYEIQFERQEKKEELERCEIIKELRKQFL